MLFFTVQNARNNVINHPFFTLLIAKHKPDRQPLSFLARYASICNIFTHVLLNIFYVEILKRKFLNNPNSTHFYHKQMVVTRWMNCWERKVSSSLVMSMSIQKNKLAKVKEEDFNNKSVYSF